MWSRVTVPDGTEYATIYVSANQKILTASCNTTSFSLTPMYKNGNATTGTLTGYALEVNLVSGDALHVQVNIQQVAVDSAPVYRRWIGTMVGRLNGGNIIKDGVALFEEFDLSVLH